MTSPTPTDEQLAAWLAGDLDDPEDAHVGRAVAADPEVAVRADRLAEVLGRLDLVVADVPAAGFADRLDAALAARLGLGGLDHAAGAVAPSARGSRGPAGDPRPPGAGPGRSGPRRRRERLDRLVPGLAVLLLIVTATTVGVRSFTDGSAPGPRPAQEQPDTPTDGAPADGDVLAATDGPTADGPTADGPTADGPTADGPTTDGPVADGPTTDGPVADSPTTDDGTGGQSTAAPPAGPADQVALGGDATDGGTAPGDGSATDGGTSGTGGGDDSSGAEGAPETGPGGDDADQGETADGAAGDPTPGPVTRPTDPPPPSGDGSVAITGGDQGDDETAGDADAPAEESGDAPQSASASSPTIADSQADLPDTSAVDAHFGHRHESAAVLGLSGQDAADRAAAHAEEVRAAPPFPSGEVPDRCLDAVLQGPETAVVVAVETVTYAGQPGLAHLVVRGEEQLDHADVTIVPAGSCDPLLVRSVPA